jgi:hypothetical protein
VIEPPIKLNCFIKDLPGPCFPPPLADGDFLVGLAPTRARRTAFKVGPDVRNMESREWFCEAAYATTF